MFEFFHNLALLLLQFSERLGYFGIVLLMTVESSFIPFPSEIVVPPAAYLAYEGKFNLYLVILSGIVGSVIGAVINYWIARSLGRAVIYSLAKRHWMRYLLITHHQIAKAEDFFLKYGSVGTFIGRLLPGIRQLISLPAGFAKMPFWPFVFYTALGSAVWVPVLAMHGYLLAANKEFVKEYFTELVIGYVALVSLIAIIVFYFKGRKKVF